MTLPGVAQRPHIPTLALVAVSLLLIPSTLRAEAASVTDALHKVCKPAPSPGVDPGGLTGRVDADGMMEALFAAYPFPPHFGEENSSATEVAELIDKAPPASKGEEYSLYMWRRVLYEWAGHPLSPEQVAPVSIGGVRIVHTDGSQIRSGEVKDVVHAILRKKATDYQFECQIFNEQANDNGGGQHLTIALAQTKEGLTDDAEKKSFAEFGLVDDKKANSRSYAITAAAGIILPAFDIQSGNIRGVSTQLTGNFMPYMEVARKGANNPVGETYLNNLNFGFELGGKFQHRSATTYQWYYSIAAEFETDDDFHSRAYSTQIAIEPDIPIVGWRTYHSLLSNLPGSLDVDFAWNLSAVADWMSIDKPGNKKELVDGAQYARIGYDGSLNFRLGRGDHQERSWALVWSTQYRLRDGLNRHGGDAQDFMSSIMLLPDKTSPYSFGLSYERGEDLTSLKKLEIWKLTFGLRR